MAAALSVVGVLGVAACEAPRKPREVEPVVRDVPAILRGQIGSEASIRGVEPILVSGFGLVVGLNGTGGGPIPVQIQATMERELARGGVGKGGPLDSGPLAGRTPRQVLRDPNVAVVIVEGVIAPGSPKDSTFDVRVRAIPTNCTSLEGGMLWTTELRLGPATRFGAMRTRKLGEARGPIFINPFADPSGAPTFVSPAEIEELERVPAAGAGEAVEPPAEGEGNEPAGPREEFTGATPRPIIPDPPSAEPVRVVSDAVNRQSGRILAGGLVTDPLLMELVLDNPSHARAASIQQAINTRFPPGPGDEGQIARGRNNSSIAVRVPRSYRDNPMEFVMLVRYLQVDPSFPQEYAKRYADALRVQPEMAEELSWSLHAVGRAAVPFLPPLYDTAEFLPRIAALRAGAKLRDPRTAPHLIAMARRGPTALRTEAIELLADLGPDAQTNMALRQLVDDAELEVRVAAYEALERRGDPTIERLSVDDKFDLHVVPARDQLVYITQQGKPRVVLFGTDMSLRMPMLASAWQDRFILKNEGLTPRVYFRDFRSEAIIQGRCPGRVRDLVRFMATRTTPENPEPGLGLTYSEVVGALYEIQKQGGIDAAFATERDRLMARLVEAQDTSLVEERPESSDRPIEGAKDQLKPASAKPLPTAKPVERQPMVVPLSPKPKK
ncbi:MAG: flagellar basal body P-ring protein FlgI [Phycisphaerales bacterium]